MILNLHNNEVNGLCVSEEFSDKNFLEISQKKMIEKRFDQSHNRLKYKLKLKHIYILRKNIMDVINISEILFKF